MNEFNLKKLWDTVVVSFNKINQKAIIFNTKELDWNEKKKKISKQTIAVNSICN